MCRRDCFIDKFIKPSEISLYLTSSDCRLRDRQGRYPLARLQPQDNQNIQPPEYLCGVSDHENDSNYLGADMGQYEVELARESNGHVPEECPTEIEPVFQHSQFQNLAFCARSEQV